MALEEQIKLALLVGQISGWGTRFTSVHIIYVFWMWRAFINVIYVFTIIGRVSMLHAWHFESEQPALATLGSSWCNYLPAHCVCYCVRISNKFLQTVRIRQPQSRR